MVLLNYIGQKILEHFEILVTRRLEPTTHKVCPVDWLLASSLPYSYLDDELSDLEIQQMINRLLNDLITACKYLLLCRGSLANCKRLAIAAGVFLTLSACDQLQPTDASNAFIHSAPTRALSKSGVNENITEIMLQGIIERQAEGGAAVLVEINTGQIMSLVSIVSRNAPDWEKPRYNRAVHPVHELGSVFKTFTIAQALDMELITPDTILATPRSLSISHYKIRDFDTLKENSTVQEVFLRSSNVGTAQISQMIGSEAQQEFFGELGLLSRHPMEEKYRSQIRQLHPSNWSKVIAATLSFGHGITASPLQIAGAYSKIINGRQGVHLSTSQLPKLRRRVVSQNTSELVKTLLKANVQSGEMSLAGVKTLDVGAYGGTSDMLTKSGSYDVKRVVSTVAAAFPIEDPKYVVVVMLENPVVRVDGEEFRTASWTVAPLVAQVIEQIRP
jgi:cell division protein FtsI (penicillin-binding protein 3)